MSSLNRNDEGILTKMAGQAEKNIKSGAQWAGKQAKKGLATLGKKAAYGAGKLVKKGIDAFKKGPTHTVGESTMNIYERIINILLEARVDMFIQDRLDEGMVKARNKAMKNAFVSKIRHQEAPGPGGLSGRESEAADDHAVRLAGAKKKSRVPTHKSEKLAVGRDNLRQGDTYNESKNSENIRSFMKSRAGEMSSGSSSFSDSAIRAKKLDRAGKHRKEGNKKAARFELGQAKKLDKPQLP